MNTPISTYYDAALGCDVKVYAPQESRKSRAQSYTPMKKRDEQRRESAIRQSFCMNAYDAAVCFGVQQEEAQYRPETSSDFEQCLKQERAKFNRRKRK